MSTDASSRAALSPVKRALLEIRELRARVSELETAQQEAVAIVGMSIRTPGGVRDPEAFARLLWSGTDAITDIPASRWPLAEWFDEAQEAAGKMYTRFGGFLDDVDQFDADFFGISPAEASSMDPQQRIVLELSWEALEDAGHAPSSLAGTQAGIYLGISNGDYGRALFAHPEIIDPYFSPGNAYSVAAGRVAYTLGTHGPAISIDTACSSSLVALHLACQGLRQRECDLALAGGINLILTPEFNVNFSKAGMMSRDGRCHTFDADGSGYVRGEGGGMVVLRRLRDALADGDRILAVVRGSAVNQDGRSNGLMAPNGPAQEAVVRAALSNAGVAPAQVSYVETHGTGTSLGDPIEVNALTAVLGEGRASDSPLMIGALKTNVGHLEAAAGVAGVIKTVLALQRQEIPPNLHFHTPNPFIDWTATPLHVPTAVTPWATVDGRRIAGVSSFGFSGTNAHVVLESAPELASDQRSDVLRDDQVLALSARDAKALRVLATQYRDHLTTMADSTPVALADVCFTANAGRAHLSHRLTVSGTSAASMASGLEAWLSGTSHPRVIAGVANTDAPRVAFLFPGQGPQYVGMGRALYESAPVFRDAFDACAVALDALLPQPIRPIVFPADGDATLLNQTAYAQPAMFAIEYALATLWRAWGITPAAVMGHSFGEYAAACVAGVVSLEDAATMVAARGRLVAALPGDGLMTVVEASEQEILDAIGAQSGAVAIAAVNGTSNTVISGERSAVTSIAGGFRAAGRRVKDLRVSHAFHSPLMDPVLDAFEDALSAVTYAAPTVRFISNLTGRVADVHAIGHTTYWRDHLRYPVRFADSIQVLAGERISHYVEMSPHPVLLGMAAECVQGGSWLPSLREDQGAWAEILLSLQRLYVDGATVNWAAVDGHAASRRRVALPTYPFQRRRHWIDVVGGVTVAPADGATDLWAAVSPALDAQSERGPLDLNAESYPAKWDCLARLTYAQIWHTLRELGVFSRKGESHTVDTILDVTGILAAHRHLVTRWLTHLVNDGTLRRDGDVYLARESRTRASLADLWAEAEQRFRDNREILEYVKNCATLLPRIVTGRESALESLFPRGSFELATGLYERSTALRYINGLASAGMEAISNALPSGRTLRVLEIGAGTGGTTSWLLKALPANRTDYLFTDVSDSFLDRARTRFAGRDGLRFGLYDLDVDPSQQGYTAGEFDVIVSANCVHASRDLRAVLDRFRTLLAPGGVLMLIESTVHFDYFDITTGLIEGWQAFADDLRTDNPLIAPAAWTGAMRTAGFSDAQAWPAESSAAFALGQHVILARAPGHVPTAVHASKSTATISVAPDVAVAEHDDVRARLAAETPSERLGVLEAYVSDAVSTLLRRDADDPLDRRDRLMERGLDSLMAVQLRGVLSRNLELDTPLPATLIFEHPTVEAIARHLHARLYPVAATTAAEVLVTPQAASAASVKRHDEVREMSDAEIAALLEQQYGSTPRLPDA